MVHMSVIKILVAVQTVLLDFFVHLFATVPLTYTLINVSQKQISTVAAQSVLQLGFVVPPFCHCPITH